MPRNTNATARAEPPGQLRDDVRLLGGLVGEVLREQGGPGLLAGVERVRRDAIAWRSAGAGPDEGRLEGWMSRQSTRRLLQIIRAFGVYFHVINLAEQNHRLRTLAERERAGEPIRESLAEAVDQLRAQGVDERALWEAIEDLTIHPVFTAHPSEARRRTLLLHLDVLANLIAALDNPLATPRSRETVLDDLRRRITLLWQTAETRSERPSVIDEVESVLHPLSEIVYTVVPVVHRSLEAALTDMPGRDPVIDAPRLIRLGTWVGGDRDGNPAVTATVTLGAARIARAAVLRRYLAEVQALGRELSISNRLAGASPALLASLDRDRLELGVQAVERWRDEPYRRKLGLIAERLRRDPYTGVGQGGPGAYPDAPAFIADIDLVRESLAANPTAPGVRLADGPLLDLRRRVETFGLHLAELEIRQDSGRHLDAVDELLGLTGVAGYRGLPEDAKLALFEERLAGPPLALPAASLSTATREVLDTFRAMLTIQQFGGPDSCRTAIISMARAASDVLAVLFLAREAGLFHWPGGDAEAESRLDVVPLFEKVDELRECGRTLATLLAGRAYRTALRARGNRQQVMVGYSDSTKDGGYLAGAWRTYRAQQDLAAIAAGAGIELIVFHGRGGTVGRGGGPMGRAILARPSGARSPYLKTTEQGEVIFARYGNAGIAERHFEQMISAALLSSASAQQGDPAVENPGWVETMERLAEASRHCYEEQVKQSQELLEFFRKATPFHELATLNLASRPVSRTGRNDGPLSLDTLRAIPWVFSWTQARVNLPGWFGLGTALSGETRGGGLDRLQQMYRDWPYFATTIDNAQISLATTDMPTARRYAALADSPAPFATIEAEYSRTVDTVLAVTEQRELLEHAPVLSRSIKLRNPYVDALHLAQVTLLRRFRTLPSDAPEEERDALIDAIHHSINGIAAGLQSTG